jgi:hypothetical protein
MSKMETIQTTMNRVMVGDRILGELVTGVSQESQFVTMIRLSGLKNPARIPSEWPVTISRPVADPCPRGRMGMIDGLLAINGKMVCNMPSEIRNATWDRLIALFNEAEAAPVYRSTAEIEAGLEAGK